MSEQILNPLEWYTKKMKVSDLIPYKYNPRKISEVRKGKLRQSLEKFNLVEIPVVNYDNTLIAGHQRVFMLFDLGRGDDIIDVRVPNRALTEQEFKEYNLISNIDYAEFDWEKIDSYFNEIDLDGIGMDIEGYNAFIEHQNISLTEQELDFSPDINEVAKSKIGDVFEFHSLQKGIIHRVVCGDSTKDDTYDNLLQKGEVFNCVVTDPPYNVNYKGSTKHKLQIKNDNMSSDTFYNFLYNFFSRTYNRSSIGGPIYIFYADSEAVNFRNAMIDAGYKISSVLIWSKNHFVLGRLDYHMQHEPILYGWQSEGKHYWYSDRKQSSVLEFDKPLRNADHPTIKPLDLIVYLINNSSRQKDIIGDLFLGSGTGLIACEQTWRQCRGVEFDPLYMDVVVKRYIDYMKENRLKFKVFRNNKELTDNCFNKVTTIKNKDKLL